MQGKLYSGKLLRGDVEIKVPAEKIKYESRTEIVLDFIQRHILQEKYRLKFLFNGFFLLLSILLSMFLSPLFLIIAFHFFKKAMRFSANYGYTKHISESMDAKQMAMMD